MTEGQHADTPDEENGLTLDESESQELQEVFSTIFPQYLLPIEELVGQILDGDTTDGVVEGLRSAIVPLASAAETIGATTLGELLREFEVATSAMLDDESEAGRSLTIDVFYRLKEAVQGLSGKAADPSPASRDFIARLNSIEGVGSADVQRILAAGLVSADQIAQGSIDEIASVTGLGEELAERIHRAFASDEHESGEAPQAGEVTPRAADTRAAQPSPQPSHAQVSSPVLVPLDARLALVVAVRSRLRLAELVARETTACRSSRASLEEVDHETARLSLLVAQSREQLKMERDATRASLVDLGRLKEEFTKTSGAADALIGPETTSTLIQLHARLLLLSKRASASAGGD